MKNEITIKIGGADVVGDFSGGENDNGLVIFVHGSGNNRKNHRNIFLAEQLNKQNISTFVFDLLVPGEDKSTDTKIDIELLTDRLVGVTKWCMENERFDRLPIGYFGSNSGAGAALSAAAYWGSKIRAVVSRGGRPDLAGDVLDLVESPTLLIVGGLDKSSIDFNRQAYIHIGCEKKTEIVLGASHLFEEPGTLEKVADLASKWFVRHF